jgi:H+/Cl- antiporter ClcA
MAHVDEFSFFSLHFFVGAINWALPATVGNGSLTTNWVISFGKTNEIEEKLLLCTGFARAFLLGISMNSGFIGGMIFPFISMGAVAATVAYRHYPYLPLGYCLGCFMFALPCGVVPLPFTFTCLACFIFFFGSYETVPIFISVLTSYLCLCGSGLLKKLGSPPKAQDEAAVAEAIAKAEEEKKQFKVDQYSNKRFANK